MEKEKIDLIGQLLTERKTLKEIMHHFNGEAKVGVILSTSAVLIPSSILSTSEIKLRCVCRMLAISKQLEEL